MTDPTAGEPTADPVGTPRTVTAVVLAWQAEPWLPECVESLLASTGVDLDVVLVDNGCTTDDVEKFADHPGVTIVRPGRNLGFSGGCNAGAAVADGEFIALVNSDVRVEPTTMRQLADALAPVEPGDVPPAVAVASVRLAEDPALINAGANPVHVLGVSWCGDFNQPEHRTAPTDTACASGSCVMTTREHWRRLDGFDEEYFAYHEDTEFSLRTWQQGRRVVYVPSAVAVHRYEFSRNPTKMYLVERNRLMLVGTLWSGRALALLAPPLAALELTMLALAAKQGWVREKVRGWHWLVRNRAHVRARRRQVRGERRVPDTVWMALLTPEVDASFFPLAAGRGAFNAAMRTYWAAVRGLV